MPSDEERKAITAVMQRLLAGKPLRASGELTIVALAAEAGLKRNKLTHKHVDLKTSSTPSAAPASASRTPN